MGIKGFFELLKQAGKGWSEVKASRLAAALAFYTALSLAPLLIMIVAIAGLILSGPDAQAMIAEQAEGAMGEDSASMITGMLENGPSRESGIAATILSFAAIFFSASTLFNQLQDAFNDIWDVPPDAKSGILKMLLMRVKAMGMVLGIGLMLIFTSLLTIIVQVAKGYIEDLVPLVAKFVPIFSESTWTTVINNVLPIVDIAVSLLVLILLFGWMFKNIPLISVKWRDVWLGAIVTAILFIVGKYLLAIYLSGGSVGAAYGAAGSLLVLLVWVYYSGQILFFGAELAQAYAINYGSLREGAVSASGGALVAGVDGGAANGLVSAESGQQPNPHNLPAVPERAFAPLPEPPPPPGAKLIKRLGPAAVGAVDFVRNIQNAQSEEPS